MVAIKSWIWKEIAEVIGVLGIIAGIVFLGFELRQNNDFLAAQARYNLRVQRLGALEAVDSAHVMEALLKYGSGDNATPAEIAISRTLAVRLIGLWDWQYDEYRAGMLERQQLPVGAWRLWYHGQGQYPVPVEEMWQIRKEIVNPDFVQFMEENVVNER